MRNPCVATIPSWPLIENLKIVIPAVIPVVMIVAISVIGFATPVAIMAFGADVTRVAWQVVMPAIVFVTFLVIVVVIRVKRHYVVSDDRWLSRGI